MRLRQRGDGKLFGTLKTKCLYYVRFPSRAEHVYFHNFECASLKNSLTSLKIRASLRKSICSANGAFLSLFVGGGTAQGRGVEHPLPFLFKTSGQRRFSGSASSCSHSADRDCCRTRRWCRSSSRCCTFRQLRSCCRTRTASDRPHRQRSRWACCCRRAKLPHSRRKTAGTMAERRIHHIPIPRILRRGAPGRSRRWAP